GAKGAVSARGVLRNRLVHQPVEAEGLLLRAGVVLLRYTRRRIEQASQRTDRASLRQRVEDNLAIPLGATHLVEQRTRVQPRRGVRRHHVVGTVKLAVEVVDRFRTADDVGRNRTGEIVDRRGKHALRVVIQRQGALGSGELHVNTLLGGDSERGVLLGGILQRQVGTRANGVVIRQTDAQRGADLGAITSELVVVLAVDVLEEGVGVFPETNGLVRDLVDSKKAIGHWKKSREGKADASQRV